MWVEFHDLALANTLLVIQSHGLAQQLHKFLNIPASISVGKFYYFWLESCIKTSLLARQTLPSLPCPKKNVQVAADYVSNGRGQSFPKATI